MTHAGKLAQWIGDGHRGVEIGAGASPVQGLSPAPVYVDCFKSFGAAPNHADYFGHACALPFHDHSLDYVIASHVLEHVANPVAALAECYRVVQPGGIIYLVLPDRRATWEHGRTLTAVSHLLDDFRHGTTACDDTHIEAFVHEADWSRFEPDTPEAEVPARRAQLARGMHEAVARGEDINIHFHTFEPGSVREWLTTLMAAHAGVPRFWWEVLEVTGHFPAANPNGILAVLRVQKNWSARAHHEAFRLRTAGDPHAALRSEAEPFDAWAARTSGLGGAR
ncbi:MAG: methyltransferase domain-containing protein [Verrucomicrobiota bacterium]